MDSLSNVIHQNTVTFFKLNEGIHGNSLYNYPLFKLQRDRRQLWGITIVYQCKIYNSFCKTVVYFDAFRYRRQFYPTTAVYPSVITLIRDLGYLRFRSLHFHFFFFTLFLSFRFNSLHSLPL